MTKSHRLLLCFMTLLGMGVVGCHPQAEEALGEAQLSISVRQALSAADITHIQVEVSAADMPSRTVALVKTGSRWGGTIGQLPAGSGRTFKADAFDSAGSRLYAGEASGVTIVANETAVISITLQELAPAPPFENAAPVITSLVASPATVSSGGTLTLTATATDANAGDVLTVAWTAPSGTFASASSLSTTWMAPSSTGSVPLTLTVTDSKGASVTVTLAVQVRAQNGSAEVNVSLNTWPQVSSVNASSNTVDVGESTSVMASVTDADGDALTYTWSSSCEGTWTHGNSASAIFTPTVRPAGDGSCAACPLVLSVQDGQGGSTTGTLTICVGPKPAAWWPPEVVETFQSTSKVSPGGTVLFRVKAADPQDAALSFEWSASAGTLDTVSTGAQESEVRWTAPDCVESAPTVSVTVHNALGLSVVQSFSVLMEQTCAASYGLILSGTTYAPGEPITVQWSAPSNHFTTDWVGLYKTGTSNTSYLTYKYVPAGSSGSLSFTAPAEAGTYEFRYLLNNGYTHVASSSSFTVDSSSELSCSTYNFRSYRDQVGQQISCHCAATSSGTIWGTDIYTDDSSVCGAAIHAGVISSSGGRVTVLIQPGQSSYTGSIRNGISTNSYGTWLGSFSFISSFSPAAHPGMAKPALD